MITAVSGNRELAVQADAEMQEFGSALASGRVVSGVDVYVVELALQHARRLETAKSTLRYIDRGLKAETVFQIVLSSDQTPLGNAILGLPGFTPPKTPEGGRVAAINYAYTLIRACAGRIANADVHVRSTFALLQTDNAFQDGSAALDYCV